MEVSNRNILQSTWGQISRKGFSLPLFTLFTLIFTLPAAGCSPHTGQRGRTEPSLPGEGLWFWGAVPGSGLWFLGSSSPRRIRALAGGAAAAVHTQPPWVVQKWNLVSFQKWNLALIFQGRCKQFVLIGCYKGISRILYGLLMLQRTS